MGFLDNLREGKFRLRIMPSRDARQSMNITDEKHELPNQIDDAIDSGNRIDLSGLRDLMSLKTDRNEQYKAYEEMVADGRIGAAVEMYANDTVQTNQAGHIIWVESDDANVAEYGNKLIQDLGLEQSMWSYAYCLWLYGDVYLELFENTSTADNTATLLTEPVSHNPNFQKQVPIKGSVLERYVEKVPNAADIYDLQFKGKTAGFIRSKEPLVASYRDRVNTYSISSATEKVEILSPMKFVHVCLSPNINRYPEKFSIVPDTNRSNDTREGGSAVNENSVTGACYTVLKGQSMLENVYSPYQSLKLKEDSILLERVTKASITRIIQVELGDMPEAQKDRVLRDLKDQIEQQLQLNKASGDVHSRPSANPSENIIYTTTKNGKGVINTVNIGGETDLGSMEDVEKSENKLYGALQVNKAALGADMDGSGLSNGGSLTELNAIYARRIVRGQTALIHGVTNLINIFALKEGLAETHVNNFVVKMQKPATSEDTRRDEILATKIRNAADLLNLLNDKDIIDDDSRLKIIAQIMIDYLSQQDIADVLSGIIESKEAELEEEAENEDEGTFDNISTSGGSASHRPLGGEPDFDKKPEGDNTPNLSDFESNVSSNSSDELDLSSIEGEDLL